MDLKNQSVHGDSVLFSGGTKPGRLNANVLSKYWGFPPHSEMPKFRHGHHVSRLPKNDGGFNLIT